MNNKEIQPLVHAENIWKSFGKYSVIEDVSLSISAGTVYGLVGLNGVGKTTFLRLLLQLLTPDRGSTSLFSGMVFSRRELMYRRCGVVLDHDGFWGNLTIMENLQFYADAKGIGRSALDHYLQEDWAETGLPQISKKVKHLSRGQKMQCALCRAFLGSPEILFLDEPVIALDLHAYRHFCSLIKKARNRNAAIIISSHQLELIDELCDRAGILKDKSLTEINRLKKPTWIIIAEERDEWRRILEMCRAENITFQDGWKFTVETAEVIPECVTRLSASGCKIYGIYETGDHFSSAIRTVFGPGKC
jgi:ABC-2 type transport system ATP-binding protein